MRRSLCVVTIRPGFPGHALFLGPRPGGFPEIWLFARGFSTVCHHDHDRLIDTLLLNFLC